MKILLNKIRGLCSRLEYVENHIKFMDNILGVPEFNKLYEHFNLLEAKLLGVEGPNDKYHFQEQINIVKILEEKEF